MPILSKADQKFFDDFSSVPLPANDKLPCLVRLHNGELSVERNSLWNRFCIWFWGRKNEYVFKNVAQQLAKKIEDGLLAGTISVKGEAREKTQAELSACYERYSRLVKHYALKHEGPGFNSKRFLRQPLDAFLDKVQGPVGSNGLNEVQAKTRAKIAWAFDMGGLLTQSERQNPQGSVIKRVQWLLSSVDNLIYPNPTENFLEKPETEMSPRAFWLRNRWERGFGRILCEESSDAESFVRNVNKLSTEITSEFRGDEVAKIYEDAVRDTDFFRWAKESRSDVKDAFVANVLCGVWSIAKKDPSGRGKAEAFLEAAKRSGSFRQYNFKERFSAIKEVLQPWLQKEDEQRLAYMEATGNLPPPHYFQPGEWAKREKKLEDLWKNLSSPQQFFFVSPFSWLPDWAKIPDDALDELLDALLGSPEKVREAIEIGIPQHDSITIQTVQGGEILGWSWLIPPHKNRFSCRAIEATRVISLDGKCLRNKCEENHDLGFELLKRLAVIFTERLEVTRKQLINIYDVNYHNK